MKKAGQKRLFSTIMVVAFLATSTLACAAQTNTSDDIHSAPAFHKTSDNPYSSDQQAPFEEKEKEFEDRNEAGEKINGFVVSLYFICDIGYSEQTTYSDFLFVIPSQDYSPGLALPLFLSHHTLLI